jgi:transposase
LSNTFTCAEKRGLANPPISARKGLSLRRHLSRPWRRRRAFSAHLEEISRHVADGAHAVLLLDGAGWHTTAKLDVPSQHHPISLLSRAPELNPVENIWQIMRGNWLPNVIFDTYDDIVRRRLRRLAQTHRPARNDHLRRHANAPQLGRSIPDHPSRWSRDDRNIAKRCGMCEASDARNPAVRYLRVEAVRVSLDTGGR